jgi:predicted PhzF superfamily epimerase YddE/YHI9
LNALPYWVVDAFTDRLFAGNPAAVVLPEAALPDGLMQQIAAENNLSETAFAVREGDGFRLRWFTPTVEVDLCGHATLAALVPDSAAIAKLPGGAVIVTAQGGPNADITSRYFAPAYGIIEDPATGSLHTQVVPYWSKRLGRETLACFQASKRGGRMTCTLAADRVLIRGSATLYASGTLAPTPPRT